MTTRYRVEYALKTHRRDQLIEWIKGLLAVPFVLHAQPTVAYEDDRRRRRGEQCREEGEDVLGKMAAGAKRRYGEILRDVGSYFAFIVSSYHSVLFTLWRELREGDESVRWKKPITHSPHYELTSYLIISKHRLQEPIIPIPSIDETQR